MKSIIYILSIIFLISCNHKETVINKETLELPIQLSEAYISQKAAYFTINNGTIKGDGLNVWKELITQSQFVALGERHDSEATSQLVDAILPILDTTGYHHFAIEVGPHSAKKLKQLSTPIEDTEKNLTEFIAKYAGNESYSIPIPFFRAISDAKFLKTARSHHMNLWGLDQEYYSSSEYFMDELLVYATDHPKYEEIKMTHQKVKAIIKKWSDIDDDESREIDLFEEIQKDTTVQSYLSHFRKMENTREIINDLEISWDIYSRWRDDSHADRISYMRTNFMNAYTKALEKESEPKVLLKFGSLHTSKILTGNCYDLGDLVTQLALKNGTQATTINSWNRYYIDDDGTEIDYLEKYSNYYNRLQSFMSLAKKDQWVIINLKSIRDDIINGKVILPKNGDYHRIKALIDGYDYQLILPLDQKSKGLVENY
ncbi:hypothetical protein GCM10011344_46000 [Dokdonia pacifica]|uniref:Erythromycin esterase homolog n=1 Tax=Dokdonia pacifica TaxID=1627892 RepID=A0A239DCR1_9FLAO|nr:hypothetical protein [Dokdonia pacifica]GGG39949.1 hypothetical protein GCM10011344_46000 [Dokdonia pacifica]SNS30087.1 hypothetical protein SAMN06265376_110102 [Dokdonia pacifica]